MDVRSIHLATRLLCLSSGRCKLPSMLASGGVASPMNVAILPLSLADGAIEHLCRILEIKRREKGQWWWMKEKAMGRAEGERGSTGHWGTYIPHSGEQANPP